MMPLLFLPKANRSQFFPKVSASYVLSDEKFMKDSFVSSARLRASWENQEA